MTDGQLWNLESNLIFPEDGKLSFYSDLLSEVNAKNDEGFVTQLVSTVAASGIKLTRDRLLGTSNWRPLEPRSIQAGYQPKFHHVESHKLRPQSSKWSTAYANHYCFRVSSFGFCFIHELTFRREPDELVIPENATTWEFTPYEFGSWAFGSTTKVRGAFTPIEYLGTRMNNGQVNGSCYKGFDQMR